MQYWSSRDIGRALLAAGLLLGAGRLGAAEGPADSGAAAAAETSLAACEAHHAGLEALSASFTQTYRSAATGLHVVESGRVFVKSPGLMRWDYRKPDRKVFLVDTDGSTLAYVPADRSAVRARLPPEAPHLRLLRGESDLAADFSVSSVSLARPAVPGSLQLKLEPRRTVDGVATAYLELSPEGRAIHRVLVIDELGNESDLVFERIRENPRLKARDFHLDLPPGVELRDLTSDHGS